MAPFQQRLDALRSALTDSGLALAVVSTTDHMRYLIGWCETGHERLIALFVPSQGRATLVVTALNSSQAQAVTDGLVETAAWTDRDGWHGVVAPILAAASSGVAIDDELHAGHLLHLQTLRPELRYVSLSPVLGALRARKDGDELAAMRRSAQVTDEVVEVCAASLRTGVTERQVQEWVNAEYRRRGAEPAFALICFGANTARPHHASGERALRDGDLVILDIGCFLDGYASDITRTLAFGEPDPEASAVYDLVHAAHMAAFDGWRPGMSGDQLDEVTRQVIEAGGYGPQFVHRTGHGIGLSVHEPPYIASGSDSPLLGGMCFSIEPGIYLEGRFGVRLERIATVGHEGLEPLNRPVPERLPVLEAR